jgi:hypothetical protein
VRGGLDAALFRGDVRAVMDRPASLPVPRQPLLARLPLPARRMGGFWLLTLTLWLASFLALVGG